MGERERESSFLLTTMSSFPHRSSIMLAVLLATVAKTGGGGVQGVTFEEDLVTPNRRFFTACVCVCVCACENVSVCVCTHVCVRWHKGERERGGNGEREEGGRGGNNEDEMMRVCVHACMCMCVCV